MSKHPLLGFSTIGEPHTSFQNAIKMAEDFDLQFVELRCLEDTTDLPSCFGNGELLPTNINVRVVDTSLCLLEATPEDVNTFYRHAELAHRLHSPFLRVFGVQGGAFGDGLSDEQLDSAAALVRTIRRTLEKNHWDCELLLETHDNFSSSERCLALNARLNVPLRIIWDSHHTWWLSGEQLDETWNRIGSLVAHVHYKDSVSDSTQDEGMRYVAPGEGKFPTELLCKILQREGYTGGISLEWERLWHPYLPPLSKELALFRNIFAPLQITN